MSARRLWARSNIHPCQNRAEALLLEKGYKLFLMIGAPYQLREWLRQGHLIIKGYEFFRKPCLLGMLNQQFPAAGLLYIFGMFQKIFEIIIEANELSSRFNPDPRYT